jgi:hypothetical protein
MVRGSVRVAGGAVALACALVVPAPAAGAAAALPPTELLGGNGTAIPLKNAAMVTTSEWGYVYKAGQQDSRLTVTYEAGRVHFRDSGTRELRTIPKRCREHRASPGIAVSCRVPARFDADNPTFVQVWPRLGDDHVDASSMPAMFRMWVLGDAGRDVVRTGAGDDFVNGAQDADVVYGGDGDDWLRTGLADDEIHGEGGNDQLVGVDGNDTIFGGSGDDRVGGGPGRDSLDGEAGEDVVLCGGGPDSAWADALDRVMKDCESVTRS